MNHRDDAAELEALASDPLTDWDVLHWIAENHPELRPLVAANPGTYEELVEALAGLGDSDIDAAIAQRHRGRDVSSAAAATNPLVGMYDTATHDLPAYPFGAVGDDDAVGAENPPQSAPTAVPDDAVGWNDPVEEPAPVPAFSRGGHASGTESEAEDLRSSASYREPNDSRWSWPMGLIGALVLGIVVVGSVFALVALFLGGGEDESVAEPGPSPTPAPEESLPVDEGEAEEEPAVDEEAIAQARAAVLSLPQESSCTVDDDAPTVAAFLTVASVRDAWPDDDDASMLEDTFAGLQDECSPTHSAGVFEAARSGLHAPEGDAGQALTYVGTDWVERAIGLGGAQQMSSFITPDGNIQCEFGDGVRCTAFEHDYSAPSGCNDGTTYRMQVDGGTAGPHCEDPAEETDREILAVDESATDGLLVCLSLSDRVSCYNSLTATGFEISERGHYPY